MLALWQGASMHRAFFGFPFNFGIDYRLAVGRVCHALSVEPVFGDEAKKADALLNKLQEEIQSCHIGFYDITGLNSNVLIELGIAFASNRPTFVLFDAETHKKLPFGKAAKFEMPSDISERSRLFYQGYDSLAAEVRAATRDTLKIGVNSHIDLKARVEKLLRARTKQKISEIASGIGGDVERADVEAAVAALARCARGPPLQAHVTGEAT